MLKNKAFRVVTATGIFFAGFAAGRVVGPGPALQAQTSRRVFEIRRYTTLEGRLDALHARFRDHTIPLFQRHGMTSIGYWTPIDSTQSQNTLIYILAHSDRDAAQKNWDAFRADPDWVTARTESEAHGQIVEKVDSIFLTPTDYSPLK